MRITINVTRNNAAALVQTAQQVQAVGAAAKSTSGSLGGLSSSTSGTNSMFGGFNGLLSKASSGISGMFSKIGQLTQGMTNFGKNMQWTGRQIEFRFTLPIVAALGAGVKFAMANEAAFTRLKMVYDDTGLSSSQLTTVLGQLQQSFRMLSDIFGVNQAEVIKVGADWAAAGKSGVALAKATQLTMETMAIAGVDAATATNALITIQDAYGLSSDDLGKSLTTLNAINNVSALQFKDLIDVVQTVAGSARTAGVDIQHLGAMAAALVPAAGSGSEAANALKTTIANVMAPTDKAANAIQQLGINLNDAAWQNANFTQRIEQMSGAYANLDQVQKLNFARQLVNIRQISRLAILLDDVSLSQLKNVDLTEEERKTLDEVVDARGRYNRALKESGDASKNASKWAGELDQFLGSDPQRFKIAITQIQNALADIVIPILPVLLSALNSVRNLVTAFTNLSPHTQKLVLTILLLLAALGPVIAYAGALITLFGSLFGAISGLAGVITAIAGVFGISAVALLGWIALIVAIGVAVYIFRDQIWTALKDANDAVGAFVNGAAHYFMAFVHFMFEVGKKVYEALQWMNPFATHSPSLVDSVKAGVATILDEYSSLTGVGAMLADTMTQIEAFKASSSGISIGFKQQERGKQRGELAGLGASPETLAQFDQLGVSMDKLEVKLPVIQHEIDAQNVVVARWADSLHVADMRLQAAQDGLDALTESAQRANDALNAAQQILDGYYNTSIQGEGAASQAIFDNEMAIKALRLELLQLQDAGNTVEDTTNKLAALSGEIENLQGLEKNLRLAGAGSEITGPIRAQIAALDAQRRGLSSGGGGGSARIDEVTKQLDALGRKAEMLDLEKSLKFDPLNRQLDLLKNGLKELPFDQLRDSIVTQQRVVAGLTTRYDESTAAVKAQQRVVDGLKVSRDAISKTYDVENEKLRQLEDAYHAVENAITSMKDAMTSLQSQGKTGGGGAGDLGQGDFAKVGGTKALEGAGNWDEYLAQLQAKLDEAKNKFDNIDLFKGIKEKIANFKKGWHEADDDVHHVVNNIGQWITDADNDIHKTLNAIGQRFTDVWDKSKERWSKFEPFFTDTIPNVFHNLNDGIHGDLNAIGQWFTDVWADMKKVWNSVESFFTDTIPNVFHNLNDGIHSDLNTIGQWFTDVWAGMKRDWNSIESFFTDTIPKIFHNLNEGIHSDLNAIGQWFTDLLGPINDVINQLSKVKGLFGGSVDDEKRKVLDRVLKDNGITDPAEIDRIRKANNLAEGGIVMPRPGGSIFRLGEAGHAEAVIPLDGKHGMGDTIVINGNLEFPNIRGAGDADGFVRNLKTLAGAG